MVGTNIACIIQHEIYELFVSDSGANWPTTADIDYFASTGMNIFRIPFKWERLQPTLGQAFDSSQESALDSIVNYATGKGIYVIVDPHK